MCTEIYVNFHVPQMTGINNNPEHLIAWLLDHSHLEIPDIETPAPQPETTFPHTTQDEVIEENDRSEEDSLSSSDENDEDSDNFDFELESTETPIGKNSNNYCYGYH